MKKLLSCLLALFLIIGPTATFAQESTEKKSAEKEGMYMCMCPMHNMMMKNMMKMDVVATQDGGVVVLTGTKMVKYDKDLNQVKEISLHMDMENVRKTMQKQMKDCPMRQKMMESGEMMHGGKMMPGDYMHRKMMQQKESE